MPTDNTYRKFGISFRNTRADRRIDKDKRYIDTILRAPSGAK